MPNVRSRAHSSEGKALKRKAKSLVGENPLDRLQVYRAVYIPLVSLFRGAFRGRCNTLKKKPINVARRRSKQNYDVSDLW